MSWARYDYHKVLAIIAVRARLRFEWVRKIYRPVLLNRDKPWIIS